VYLKGRNCSKKAILRRKQAKRLALEAKSDKKHPLTPHKKVSNPY
jgi:hypothetical protein